MQDQTRDSEHGRDLRDSPVVITSAYHDLALQFRAMRVSLTGIYASNSPASYAVPLVQEDRLNVSEAYHDHRHQAQGTYLREIEGLT